MTFLQVPGAAALKNAVSPQLLRGWYWMTIFQGKDWAPVPSSKPHPFRETFHVLRPITMVNGTDTQGWTSAPDLRGTSDIIVTCLVTTFLCCWTSVYPNIPAPTEGFWATFRDKLSLACLGILGPDFLIVLATGQRSSARRSFRVCSGAHSTLNGGIANTLLITVEIQSRRSYGLDHYSLVLCRYGRFCARGARTRATNSPQRRTALLPGQAQVR